MFEKSEIDAGNETDDADDDGSRYIHTRLGKLSTFTCVVLDDDIIPLNVQAQLISNAGTKMSFAIQPYRDGRQLRDSAGKVDPFLRTSCVANAMAFDTFDWSISGMEKKGVKRTHDSSSSSSSSTRVVTNLVESEDEEQPVNEKFCYCHDLLFLKA